MKKNNVEEIARGIRESYSWEELLNKTKANVYITDIETDEIVFMSENMKKVFGITNPEGKCCWKVLQKGMQERCQFCKVKELMENPDKDAVSIWDEENTLNGRCYRNRDTLLYLNSGKILHMQHSLDVTEYRKLFHTAQIDELTGLLNRSSGKSCLKQMLQDGKAEEVSVSVVMYDVNELKRINDLYGHKEGDHMLRYISEVVKGCLGMQDTVFRLGGDEFIIVFYDLGKDKAERQLKYILEQLEAKREENQIFYPITFSYGITEVKPEDEISLSDILIQVDERMYDQKRDFHIQKAQKTLEAQESRAGRYIQLCKYENDDLYHLLERSTEDYVFVGYLKNGTFQYPKIMVEEFDLPGQIVQNAAAVWGRLIHPDDKMYFLRSNQEIADGRVEGHEIQYRAMNRRGQWVWLKCSGQMKRDANGEPELFAGIITNLGLREKIDSVTRLPNKFEFEERLKKRMEEQESYRCTLLWLNIDHFKYINQQYDRNFGDEMLHRAAKEMEKLLPVNAELFRMDGDCFAVLSEGDAAEAEKLFGQIQAVFQNDPEREDGAPAITFSAGIAEFPADGDSYQNLLKNANYAVEFSKMCGKNRVTRFVPEILQQRRAGAELIGILQTCIKNNFEGFYVSYQPMVSAENGEVCGAEALLRWYSKEKGRVSTMEIIPVLEQSGMIVPVGRWFLKKVIEDCRDWLKWKPEYRMSVNVSYLQFVKDNLPLAIRQILEEYEVPAQCLSLELTETSLIRDTPAILEALKELKEMGVGITMDDFGSGDSSLENLKRIPVNMVKIDKVFVKGIVENTFDRMLVRFMAQLCHNVGQKVCLEGIETEEEYQIVKEFGLDYCQGYYFGKPMKKEIFESILF